MKLPFQPRLARNPQIWAVPEKGGLFRKARGEPVALTTGPLTYSAPALSVDGKKIFAIDESDPNWSPDGTSLVFFVFSQDRAIVDILDLRTHNVSLVPGSEGLYSPRWSPDGRYIAAISNDNQKIDAL